jgi:outer membrane protein, multidrug efflux system
MTSQFASRVSQALLAPLVLAGLQACSAVGPDYTPPELDLPDEWNQAALAGLEEGEADLQTWWTALNDPTLDALIERAGAGNLDLVIAATRVKETRALRRIAETDKLPTIDATGSAGRRKISENVIPGLGTNNVIQIGAEASWELDVWGRIRRNVEAAEADIQAADEDYRDVMVLLYAEVALAYVELRSLQERIRYALENVKGQEETLELVGHRFDAELVPELDVRQAELNAFRTKSSVPSLRAAQFETLHRLAVLLGEEPGAMYELIVGESAIPTPSEQLGRGIPADLLRQRPDVRAAERALAAQTARIGVATAELYPQFSLTGNFGWNALEVGDLFESGATSWGIAVPFKWNLFNRDAIHANIEIQEIRAEALQADYERIVLNALAEVETSLANYGQQKLRTEFLEGSVLAAQQTVDLVNELYKAGLTNFQNVLDSERSLFQEQDALAESQGEEVRFLVFVYRSLGGGWQPAEESTPSETEDAPHP